MFKKNLKITIVLVVLLAVAYLHSRYLYTSVLPTEKPQDAIFYIAEGYTGGLDSVPLVLPKDNSTIVTVNGLQVYFDNSASWQSATSGAEPTCTVGRPKIRINANITLTKATTWPSVVGADKMEPVEYYLAHVNKIHNVSIRYQGC